MHMKSEVIKGMARSALSSTNAYLCCQHLLAWISCIAILLLSPHSDAAEVPFVWKYGTNYGTGASARFDEGAPGCAYIIDRYDMRTCSAALSNHSYNNPRWLLNAAEEQCAYTVRQWDSACITLINTIEPWFGGGWLHPVRTCPPGFVPHNDWNNGQATNHRCVGPEDLTPPDKCPLEGNPVQVSTGYKFWREKDFDAPLLMERFYTSRPSNEFLKSGLGNQWRHSYDRRLLKTSDPNKIWYVSAVGELVLFSRGVSSLWTPSSGSSLRMSSETWGFRVVTDSDDVEEFSLAGRLSTIRSREGRVTSLTYDVERGLLSSITNDLGRSISFTTAVTSSGYRFHTATDSAGFQIEYEYSATGELSSVHWKDSSNVIRQRTYHYEQAPARPTLLTGISEENGTRYSTYAYDSASRVQTSKLWADASTAVSTFDFSYPAAMTANVNTPLGKPLTFSFALIANARRMTGSTFGCASCGTSGQVSHYDTAGYPLDATDFNGNITLYTYDALRGLELARTEASNDSSLSSPKRSTETDWHATHRVPLERRTMNRNGVLEMRSQSAYNTRGQFTASCEIDPADTVAMAYTCSATVAPTTGAKVRRTVMTYCEAPGVTAGTCPREGLLLSVNGARPASDAGMAAGEDDTVSYTYRQAEDPTCATNGACTYRKGDLWKVTNALGHVTETVSYDKNGRVTRVKDANGTVTDFSYHPRGWLLNRIVRADASGSASAGDAITSFLYDNVGQVTRVTQPDGASLGYAYDAAHRLLKITDNLDNAIDYCPGGVGTADCLDAAGNRRIERITDPSNTIKRSLRRTYNQLSQLTSVLNAQSQATVSYPTATGYDASGNPTLSQDGLGVQTKLEYDPLNRLKKTIQDYAGPDPDTANTTTQYAYDTRDNLRTVIDPENLATHYDYDGLNNLIALRSPDTGTTGYTYDAAGNRLTQTDARGVPSSYSYDALNRLVGITYPDTTRNVTFLYDQGDRVTGCPGSFRVGRLTTMTDASGNTVYCYDRRGNVTRKTQTIDGVALVTDYTYTLADRLTTITYPSGGIASYGRNALGQVTSLAWKATATATPVSVIGNASYYPFGPLNVLTYGNGRTLTKSYDQDYAIDAVASSDPNGLVLDLTTDVLGNITQARNSVGAATPTRQYVYDRLYRLSRVDYASNAMREDYAYTKTGNRTLKQFAGQAAQVYDYVAGSHRLDSVNGGIRDYDANGNTTTLPNVPHPLVYDDRNRLATVTLNGIGSIATNNYRHNGRGERVSKVSTGETGTVTQVAVYDEGGKLLRERADRTCGGGSTSRLLPVAGAIACGGNRTAEILYLDDIPVAQATDGVISYLETDHLGTPRLAANPATNAWQWRWSFFEDAFGGNAVQKATSGGIDVNLRYPGQYFDEESGLHYNYFRDYEPWTGKYVESDPIGLGGGVSTYSYALQNPLILFDPDGLKSWYCRRPLCPSGTNCTTGEKGIPGFNHHYLCVTRLDGTIECGGQSSDNPGPKPSPGRPTRSDEDSYNNKSCDVVDGDEDRCVEACLLTNFNKSRPTYAYPGPQGIDCQEWAADTLWGCRAHCRRPENTRKFWDR